MISKLSLTMRLTLLFATCSGLVLLILGWLIGGSIERHFEQQDRDTLSGTLMMIQPEIRRVASPPDLERLPVQLRDALVGNNDLRIQILGPHKEMLFGSPTSFVFPVDWLSYATKTPATRLFAWSQGGHSYRGLAASIPTAVGAWPPLSVVVAVDIKHHQAFMNAFRLALWLFVAGAALATGLLGWFAASRGLAPLRAMRKRAALVTAQKLDQRLPVDAVPAELAELAITLNEMLARLEEAFHRLADFSSDMAHELRSPISNLMMQTQVSLSRPRNASSYREVLESNVEEFERLARMISDMLFLAQAENGLAIAKGEQVDLAREVRDLFDFYDALAQETGIHLQLAGAASIRGDRIMLRRAISNLLSNALHYTPRGGGVTVTIAREQAEVVLSVDNTGETIPPQHLARLFERFYRADPSRQHASGEGTGLGLAITLAIARAHKGRISATSAAGRTRFSMRLPDG